MKNALFALLLLFFSLSNAFSQTVPFEVELEEVNFPDLPALHSFAFGEWDGKWVFLGGRSNGLHGFFPFSGFPVASANSYLWVVDGQTGESWSFDVNELPDALAEPLLATNPQYVQQGKYLAIIGGYGKKKANDDFVTHPTLLVVDLETLVPAIVGGGDPAGSFMLLQDERMRVCGGDMLRLGDYVYLVGGHDFAGLYNSSGAPTFIQTYTSEIRRFKIALEDSSPIC